MTFKFPYGQKSISYFILLDLLFFPRILFLFGIPVSLPFVIAYIFRYKINKTRILILSIIMTIGLISAFNGLLSKSSLLLSEDIKRVLQISSILLYSFIYLHSNNLNITHLALLFRVFFIWIFFISLLFMLMPQTYESFLTIVYPEALGSLDDNQYAFRFGYFFTDPNSMGYFICFVLYLYFFLEKRIYFILASILITILIVVLTQSRGSLIGLSLILMSYFLRSPDLSLKQKIKASAFFVTAFFIIDIIFNDLFDTANKMFETRSELEEIAGSSFGGGRVEKYEYFFSNLNLLPFGVGYSLIKDGMEFRPHSDLIRINFSYGLLFLIPFIYMIFPKTKSSLILFFVFMIPFLINTAIDDYKLFSFYLFALNILHFLDRNRNKEL